MLCAPEDLSVQVMSITLGVNGDTRQEAKGVELTPANKNVISVSSLKPLKWVSRKGRKSKASQMSEKKNISCHLA